MSAQRVDAVVVGLGGLGSAAAWELARRGADVVGLEQFELGHARGASHDTSRILRRSYHTAGYVRLAGEAYADWARLSAAADAELVTTVGGVVLFPPDAAIAATDYADSMLGCGVPYEVLSAEDLTARWPALSVPAGTTALFQAETAIVPAGRATATMQRLAVAAGARLLPSTPVTGLLELGDGTIEVSAGGRSYVSDRVLLTADAWTSGLLAHLGASLPLTVTCEQVTYFAPPDPGRFGPDRLPVWEWMDDPLFYGFPTYDEMGTGSWVKAAQDCGGPETTADGRSFDPDEAGLRRLHDFTGRLLPGVGEPVRTVTCLYTLTPDRDLVLGPLPEHPGVLLGLGAGHGFKFAPTFGRILADLAAGGTTSSDISAFAANRPALVDAGHPVTWLV